MLGWLCWKETREETGAADLAGLSVLRVSVLRREGTPEWLLRRRVRRKEYDALVDEAIRIGVENAFIQEGSAADESFIPAFDYEGV